MMARAGILKLGLAVALFMLWWRGYLSDLIAQAGAALVTPPPKVAFGPPGASLPALHPAAPASATGRVRGGTF